MPCGEVDCVAQVLGNQVMLRLRDDDDEKEVEEEEEAARVGQRERGSQLGARKSEGERESKRMEGRGDAHLAAPHHDALSKGYTGVTELLMRTFVSCSCCSSSSMSGGGGAWYEEAWLRRGG